MIGIVKVAPGRPRTFAVIALLSAMGAATHIFPNVGIPVVAAA